MITLNFNVPLLDVKGKETKQLLSDILADLLASETKGNPRKLIGWVRILGSEQPLLVDKADKKFLEDLIENTERIAVLIKGQLLDILDAAQEAE